MSVVPIRRIALCPSATLPSAEVLALIGEYPPDTVFQCQRVAGHAGLHSKIVVNHSPQVAARSTILTWDEEL